MLTRTQIGQADVIQQLRDDYLLTLLAPMDGMWEGSVIAKATFWEIQDQGQYAGYFCVDSDNCLLRFYLVKNYQVRAQEILRWIIATHNIQRAIASTIEPLYFSVCLDLQRSITPHGYLFHDHKRIELPSTVGNHITFRAAQKSELDIVMRFYQTNLEEPSEWIEEFLHERISRKELFVLYDQQTLVATGECIPSQKQTPFADLGMVVAQAYRGRGLGSTMLIQMKEHCYNTGWKPICACAADNHASKKAIEKAGFISIQRMVNIWF